MRRLAAVVSVALVLSGVTATAAYAPEIRTTWQSIVHDSAGQQPLVLGQWDGLNQAESFLTGHDLRWIPPSGFCDSEVQYFESFRLNGQTRPDLLEQIECLQDGPLSLVMPPFMFEAGQQVQVEFGWQHAPISLTDGCWVTGIITYPSQSNGEPSGPPVADDAAPYGHPTDDDPNCPPPTEPNKVGVGSSSSPEPVAPNAATFGSNGNDTFLLDQLPPPGQAFDVQLQCGGGDDLFEIRLPEQLPPDPVGGTIRVDTGGGLDTVLLPEQFDFFNGTLELVTSDDLILLMPDPFWAERGNIDIILVGSDSIDVRVQRPPGQMDLELLQPEAQPVVDVQITELNLASTQPIQVVIDGNGDQRWGMGLTVGLEDFDEPVVFEIVDTTVLTLDMILGSGNDLLLLDDVLLPLDPLGPPSTPWVISPGFGDDRVDLELMTQAFVAGTDSGAGSFSAHNSGAGRVVVNGGPGDDVLIGGPGPDHLDGGDGADVLDGGPGADVLTGGPGFDICNGRGGLDTLLSCDNDPRGGMVNVAGDAPLATRLQATDNVGSAVAWSQALIADGEADVALLARDDVFADGLSSGFAQGVQDAPLLLTPTAALDERVAGELQRLGTSTVHILGGPRAVSPEVEQSLRDLGLDVTRVFGDNRMRTAVAVATAFGNPTESDVVIARAFGSPDDETRGFVDSLAAGAVAAAKGWPLLLTPTEFLDVDTRVYLRDAGVTRVWLAGGPGALSSQVESDLRALGIEVLRRSGPNRFETAAKLGNIHLSDGAAGAITIIDGTAPNAWAAGLPAARTGAVVALSAGPNLSVAAASQIAGARKLGTQLVCAPGVEAGACDQADALAQTPHWASAAAASLVGSSPGEAVHVSSRAKQPWVCSVGWPEPELTHASAALQTQEVNTPAGPSHGCVLTTNEIAGSIAQTPDEWTATLRDLAGGVRLAGPLAPLRFRGLALVAGGGVDLLRTGDGRLCVVVASGLVTDEVRITVAGEQVSFDLTSRSGCLAVSGDAFVSLAGAQVELLSEGTVASEGVVWSTT